MKEITLVDYAWKWITHLILLKTNLSYIYTIHPTAWGYVDTITIASPYNIKFIVVIIEPGTIQI